MKFIFVCVTVCAMALNFYFDFVNTQKPRHPIVVANSFLNPNHDDLLIRHGYSPIHAENYYIKHPIVPSGEGGRRIAVYQGRKKVSQVNFDKNEPKEQYDKLVSRIVAPWLNCTAAFDVPVSQALDMFTNVVGMRVSKERKCVVDCTLRKMGVLTDAGLDETEYMLQIKQLRFNYTSFDINEQSNDTKQMILDTISNHTDRFAKQHSCYVIFRPKRFGGTRRLYYHDLCYELIESYALAARTCKDVKDPKGDNCETSWMIMRCMSRDHRRRLFESPFYPIPNGTVIAAEKDAFGCGHSD